MSMIHWLSEKICCQCFLTGATLVMLLFYAGLSLLVTDVVAALALVYYYNCKIPSAITIRKVKKKVCIYIYTYIYVCKCVYIYIYTYIYVCMYVL